MKERSIPIRRHIKPLGPRILVRVIKHSERSPTGLYLPDGVKEAHDEACYGQVVEVARTTEDKTTTLGENVSGIPINANILFPKSQGLTVPWDDNLRLLEVKHVYAMVEEVKPDQIQ
jgi:co-chaperonin GroES (HSP10)